MPSATRICFFQTVGGIMGGPGQTGCRHSKKLECLLLTQTKN